MMMRNQDEAIDRIGGIVSNIKHQGQDMDTELGLQAKITTKLGEDMDKT